MPRRRRGTSRSRPSTSARCWCCSTAGAACSATAWCRGASPWRRRRARSSRPTRCRASSRRSAGMRPRARPSSAPASPTTSCGRKARLSWVRGAARCRSPATETASYFMPLALAWEDKRRGAAAQSVDRGHRQDPPAGQRRRHGRCLRRRGVLPRRGRGHGQAARDRRPRRASSSSGPPPPSAGLPASNFAALPAARPQGSSSNTVVVMGERLILKGYRRLRAGASPELEMGLYLTEVVHYANCAPLAGVLEYTRQGRAAPAARDAAGVCRQSGRRLDLRARVPAAPPRRASHGARHRRAARQRARGVPDPDPTARGAHGGAAPGARARAPATRSSIPRASAAPISRPTGSARLEEAQECARAAQVAPRPARRRRARQGRRGAGAPGSAADAHRGARRRGRAAA